MITIASSSLSVDVLPEVGGKVGQISELLSGHRFLVPPQKEYRTIPLNGDWLQHDTSGMDDCFPNVAAGLYPDEPWSHTSLPDLGEWTHGAWEVSSASGRRIVMTRTGEALPYFAVKTIEFLDENTLEFSYRVHNFGNFPMRFLWSAHPLIVVEGAFELNLPGSALTMRSFPSDGRIHSWPMLNETNRSREWIAHGTSLKIFVAGLDDGWCSLRTREHSLRFAFDLKTLPVVGLWFNRYAFPAWSDKQFSCIAVEPCTSSSDLLDELDADSYPSIPVGETMEWSLQLNIQSL